MRQWEIYDFPHPSPQNPHPCVILSPNGLLNNPHLAAINILPCQSLRGRDAAKPAEVRLNGADGLDGPTVVKCQVVLLFDKADAGKVRGMVTPARQREIKRKLVDIFGLYVS